MRSRSILTFVVLGIVLALYIESFRLPAILFSLTSASRPAPLSSGNLVRSGSRMAFLSLFGPFMVNFAVLANPLLLAGSALLILRRTRAAVLCLGLATLVALQTFQLLILPIPEDEGGVMHSYMVRPLVGWGCWFGAILLALALALYSHWVKEA